MNRYGLLCILYTSFGAFFYGYDSGLTTSIIGYPEFIRYFGFNSTTLGALGSVYYGGNFIGACMNAYLPDKLGRLRTVQIASVISLLGCGMQTGAQSLPVLLVGRAIGGIACGIVWSLCPAYASEVTPPHLRGRVGGLYNININVSYMSVEWMGLGFSYLKGGQVKWRIFLGLQIVCALIMLTGSIWMPESPRWLVAQDRHEEALAILERLHGDKSGAAEVIANEESNAADHVPFYQREYNQIQAQILYERENPQLGLKAIFTRKSYRKRFLLILWFFLGQQLTAIIPLQNYQVILYKSLGIGTKMSLVLVGVWGTTALIISIFGAYFFDILGRRKNFFISLGTLTLASILLVGFWAKYESTGNKNQSFGNAAIFAMFLFLAGYGWIMNAFGYTYTPEIMPMEIRATGMAVGFASKTAVVVMLVQVTPIAIRDISWRYFTIFIAIDIIFGIGFYFWFPETAGIPLEEVAKVFGDDVVMTLDEADTAKVMTHDNARTDAKVAMGSEQVEEIKA